jgi:ADP-heptose:LPS heptosyltransferase
MNLKFNVNRITSSQKLAIVKRLIMKRIVIYRLGSIGDTVIALPCFKLIRSSYPNHEILVLTNVPVSDKTAPLISVLGDNHQLVDEVIAYPVGTRSLRVLWKLAMHLRALKADALIYLMADRSAFSAWRDWFFLSFLDFLELLDFLIKNHFAKT